MSTVRQVVFNSLFKTQRLRSQSTRWIRLVTSTPRETLVPWLDWKTSISIRMRMSSCVRPSSSRTAWPRNNEWQSPKKNLQASLAMILRTAPLEPSREAPQRGRHLGVTPLRKLNKRP